MAFELPVYSAEELLDPSMDLPGYGKLGNMTQMDRTEPGQLIASDWLPVLSLSVFRQHPDDQNRLQTLTGIRQNTATHEGVVSTLTNALPPRLALTLLEEKKPYIDKGYPQVMIGQGGPNAREKGVIAAYTPNLQIVPDNTESLPLFCHDIFARKLGSSALIDMNPGEKHLGSVSLSRINIGLSYVGDDPEVADPAKSSLWEPLMMFGAVFMLNKEYSEAIPESTKRYAYLGWTDNIDSFANDVREKDVFNLAPYVEEHEAVKFCAYGQCLATTAALIQSGDLRAHLGLR